MELTSADYLDQIAGLADDEIDLARTALAISLRAKPGISAGRFENHLKTLANDLAETHHVLLQKDEDSLELRLQALHETLMEKHDYHGDTETYDDLENADLIRVIERRKGLPIALCILAIDMGRRQGWEIYGLALPGHYVCRMDMDGKRIIFDPFEDCKILQAQDLRALIKRSQGINAELSADYYNPATNRDILIRLQNNIKFRQIEAEDYTAALLTVEIMRLIDPHEYRTLLDAGVLYSKTGQQIKAIRVLEDYIKLAPHARDREEAALLLKDLKSSLN